MWRCLLVLATALFWSAPIAADDGGTGIPGAVQALLRDQCLDCHGPDAAESDLRLDSNLEALRGGDSGETVIAPGDSGASYLIERITAADAERRMPPDSDPLTDEQVQLLRSWIDDADRWTSAREKLSEQSIDHWSFQRLVRPEIPIVDARTAIDAFLEKRLGEAGLSMSRRASRRQLIRRLFLVLHGLPPTPEEVAHFVADERADAWERLVDEALCSPRYGERLATHWLDLIRFGETHGFETNRERPTAWPFRDWVVDSFNSDKPYDEFVVEQLAGDDMGAGVGTGFLVAGPYDLVKSQDELSRLVQRQDELADMINTTGTAFLGLTLGCARCHNHKFDPVTQTDYYSLQAVFAGVIHGDRELPLSPEDVEQLAYLDTEIAKLNRSLARFTVGGVNARLLIDDRPPTVPAAPGIEHLVTPDGTVDYLPGTAAGFADDPGDAERAPNISQGGYTWWQNVTGRDVAVYRPYASGRYRVWLSWGSGWETHSEDAHYLLDRDGDVASEADRESLAVVNQKLFANGEGTVPGQPLWSGFYDAGVHDLAPDNVIVLQCGETGSGITGDVVLLEPIRDEESAAARPLRPDVRPALNAKRNVERFAPTLTRFVRFTIHATSGAQPCLDELEIYAGETNVGLASAGAMTSSSGDFVHPLHKLEHINDGRYGNSRSWISAQETGGWLQVELPSAVEIDRIVWGRDREGRYQDRLAVDYVIESSLDGKSWRRLADASDRLPTRLADPGAPRFEFDAFPPDEAELGRSLLSRRDRLTAEREALAAQRMVYAGTFTQPGPTHRLYRGEAGSPRELVVPAAIRSLTDMKLPADSPEQQRRVSLARWIIDESNPLTARVMVNRLWQFHFGTGIVDTPSDFGGNGTPPMHPELLDWLAVEFIESGWSIRHIQRLILTSDAWAQDSRPRPDAIGVDADARLLWRFPPRRLEAEGIRDCIISVCGTLDSRMGGPGFSAFEVEAENVRHYFPKTRYGPGDWRRMLYMTKVRQERDSVFGVFDCPDGSQVVPVRSRSTTPLQALNLLNSRFVMQQAEFLVERLHREAQTTEDRIDLAYQLCFSRHAGNQEIQHASEFIESTDWQQFARALLNSNEFVFIP